MALKLLLGGRRHHDHHLALELATRHNLLMQLWGRCAQDLLVQLGELAAERDHTLRKHLGDRLSDAPHDTGTRRR